MLAVIKAEGPLHKRGLLVVQVDVRAANRPQLVSICGSVRGVCRASQIQSQ